MTIGTNLSSINANIELQNSSAHNIANSNTNRFGRVETTITQNSAEAPQAIHTKTQNKSELSNTDLTKEITNQILSYIAVGANGVALQTQNEVDGTLLDIYG